MVFDELLTGITVVREGEITVDLYAFLTTEPYVAMLGLLVSGSTRRRWGTSDNGYY